jgi:hypothetical protein
MSASPARKLSLLFSLTQPPVLWIERMQDLSVLPPEHDQQIPIWIVILFFIQCLLGRHSTT